MPEALHGADVTRVRQWYLDASARRYRQTIVLSSFASPEMNALLSRQCGSHAGKAKLVPHFKVSTVTATQAFTCHDNLQAYHAGSSRKPLHLNWYSISVVN